MSPDGLHARFVTKSEEGKLKAKEMTLKDIIIGVCDEEKSDELVISVSENFLPELSESQFGEDNSLRGATVEASFTFRRVKIRIRKIDEFFLIDLCFANSHDPKLMRVLDILGRHDKTKTEKILQFLFFPVHLGGKVALLANEPIFAVLCSLSLDEKPNVLRLFLDEESVFALEMNNIDYAQAAGEALAQADREEFYEAEEERKRKQIEYETKFGFNRPNQAIRGKNHEG